MTPHIRSSGFSLIQSRRMISLRARKTAKSLKILLAFPHPHANLSLPPLTAFVKAGTYLGVSMLNINQRMRPSHSAAPVRAQAPSAL
jgi:hypothetical protein